MLDFVVVAVPLGSLGLALLLALDVVTKERIGPLLAQAAFAFVAGAAAFGILLWTDSEVGLAGKALLPVLLGLSGAGLTLGVLGLHLWMVDNTFVGRMNLLMLELNPELETLARRKPLSWLLPLFHPRDAEAQE